METWVFLFQVFVINNIFAVCCATSCRSTRQKVGSILNSFKCHPIVQLWARSGWRLIVLIVPKRFFSFSWRYIYRFILCDCCKCSLPRWMWSSDSDSVQWVLVDLVIWLKREQCILANWNNFLFLFTNQESFSKIFQKIS